MYIYTEFIWDFEDFYRKNLSISNNYKIITTEAPESLKEVFISSYLFRLKYWYFFYKSQFFYRARFLYLFSAEGFIRVCNDKSDFKS